MSKFIIAVYVDNKFGVLTRVTSMFTRRGFNIDALTVGETESPEYSRITISMSGDGYARDQMINQLRKLFNVKKVEVLSKENSINRELLLIKVYNKSENSIEIIELQVRCDNATAIRLYEKYGFVRLCTYPRFFKIGQDYADFDYMLLNIT